MHNQSRMLQGSLLLSAFLGITLQSAPGISEANPDCTAATATLQRALSAIPTDCSNASDCQTIYLLPNSCAAGFTVSRRGLAEELQRLEPLRLAAFQACLTENAHHPVCNRPYTTPECKAKRCSAGIPGHSRLEQVAPD